MRSDLMASISAYCMAVLMAMSWRSAEAVSDHRPLSAPSRNFTVRGFSPIFSTFSYKSSGKRKCSTTRSGTDAGKATFPTYVFSTITASTGIGSLIFRHGNMLVEETQLKLSGGGGREAGNASLGGLSFPVWKVLVMVGHFAN